MDKMLKSLGISHSIDVLKQLEALLALLEEEFIKDHDVRNAIIDALSDLLQQHKSPPSS